MLEDDDAGKVWQKKISGEPLCYISGILAPKAVRGIDGRTSKTARDLY
jgi:hypothetical protein